MRRNRWIEHSFLLNLAVSTICLLSGLQTAYAQSGKVILPLREATVKQVMSYVQKQTNYKVAINWDDLNPGRKVFFPSHELEVPELLQISLSGTGFTWEVEGSQIIITHEVQDGRHNERSAMTDRHSFPKASMTFIPDPWSRTQKPFDNMFNTHKTYWNYHDNKEDSIGMAVVNYRVNSAVVEKDYMDNARTLKLIHQSLTNRDILAKLDYIVITGGSSPEGNTAANLKLAAARSLAMKSYLMWQYPYLDRDIIYTFSIGEDWSGLHKMVEEDYNTPYRDQILHAIDSHTGSDAIRAALKDIDSEEAYRYIATNMLPHLRGAAAATLHFREEEQHVPKIVETHIVDTVYIERTIEKERIVLQEPEPKPQPEPKPGTGTMPELEPYPLVAFKTNLLFDVVSALNVELEFPIGQRWSIAGEWVFPWWLYEKKQYALEVGNGNLEVKYWFGNRNNHEQLTGWFMGVYGGIGYYDLEWETEGHQGEFWHTGISGGYAHTISKNGRWRMEYTLGLGYLSADYRIYVPKTGTDNEWHLIRQGNGHRNWIGPTRAKVSLVWMFNHGYRKKGSTK